MRKCLFLDRDGVINKDVDYAFKPEQIEFTPGIFRLCRHFQQRNYLVIVITNQSGIARGFYSEKDFENLGNWMQCRFRDKLVKIDAIYHCPHHPDMTGPCSCRKPKPGMLLKAIKQYRINPQLSIMIGDKESDMQAARLAGIGKRIMLDENWNGLKPSHDATQQVRCLQAILTKRLA